MSIINQSIEKQLQAIDQLWPDLQAAEVLRFAIDSEWINQPSLAEANRFCLVRLADHWDQESVHHLIQLFFDALHQPSGLLRFHYAQAIGELTGRHQLNLWEQAKRLVDLHPKDQPLKLNVFFGYFLSGYQREYSGIDQLHDLEQKLRTHDLPAWVRLMFQFPDWALTEEQHQIASSIQSLDGLRLLQRFHRRGFPLPPVKPSPSVLIQYERLAPGAERQSFIQSVKSTTELMIGSLTDTAPEGLKHSTIDLLNERAKLDPSKRAFNTVMHMIQLMKMDRDIAAGLHARDAALELLSYLKPSEIDRLVIELRNSLGMTVGGQVPAIPRLLAECLLRSPEKKWNQVMEYLDGLIKVGSLQQSIQAIHTIYYLLSRSASFELQSTLLLSLLSGVAHHRKELAILSLTTIGQLMAVNKLEPNAVKSILRKLLIAMEHRLLTTPELAYFYLPMRHLIGEYLARYPFLQERSPRKNAFFPGSFDPFSLGHEAVARSVADLGYDVYLAIDEFSWSKRTQPNRLRREILRLSIADELHLYEFPESVSVNIANDKDLEQLQHILGSDVALIVGEDVIRGASAYRQAKKINQFHHLVFARDVESDIEEVADQLGLSIERIPLQGYEAISSSLIRLGLDSEQDISSLIDPLARQFIYDYDAYKHRQLTKDELVLTEEATTIEHSANHYRISDPASGAVLEYTMENQIITLKNAQGNPFHLICDVLAEGSKLEMEQAISLFDNPDLELIGFVDNRVDLRNPCSLHFDLDDIIKDEYRKEPLFIEALDRTRRKLLKKIGELYPGQFILPLYQHRVYQRLAQLITTKNGVPLEQSVPRVLGPFLTVPYGEILKKRILPNTVTKSLHTEKYFTSDLRQWQIEEAPDYLSLENQVKMIDSFDRPVLLVDDLLNKGYRLKRLMPLFQQVGLEVDTLYLGLISRRGRDIAESYNLPVASAYELPNLRHWFSESKLYPYLGGDSVYDVKSGLSPAFWPSINLIYPYNRIPFLKHIPINQQYDFSATCLDHAIELMEVLETLFQTKTYRHPQLKHLPEWIYLPRYPYYGRGILPEESFKPSRLLRQDREWLERLR